MHFVCMTMNVSSEQFHSTFAIDIRSTFPYCTKSACNYTLFVIIRCQLNFHDSLLAIIDGHSLRFLCCMKHNGWVDRVGCVRRVNRFTIAAVFKQPCGEMLVLGASQTWPRICCLARGKYSGTAVTLHQLDTTEQIIESKYSEQKRHDAKNKSNEIFYANFDFVYIFIKARREMSVS